MSIDQYTPAFEIKFSAVERKPWKPGFAESYSVEFTISDEGRTFVVPVWVHDNECRPSDVVRLAMHRLHRDLAELSKATASLLLSDEAYATLAPKD